MINDDLTRSRIIARADQGPSTRRHRLSRGNRRGLTAAATEAERRFAVFIQEKSKPRAIGLGPARNDRLAALAGQSGPDQRLEGKAPEALHDGARGDGDVDVGAGSDRLMAAGVFARDGTRYRLFAEAGAAVRIVAGAARESRPR